MGTTVTPLSDADLRDLVSDVIDTSASQPFGAYAFASDDPGAEIARHVERIVFLEAFGNTAELLAHEYGPYEATSVFLCVIDQRRRLPAGSMRLIVPTLGGPGLKTLHDIDALWKEPDAPGSPPRRSRRSPLTTWDIATLAVVEGYRAPGAAGLVSLGLYQSTVRTALSNGGKRFVAILDYKVYRMSRMQFGRPFVPLGSPKPYLGSEQSLPVACDLHDWKRRLTAAHSPVGPIIFDGTGIEAAMLSVSREDRLAAVASLVTRPPGRH